MTSRLARYSLVFAIVCALAAIVSGLGYRWGWWSLDWGFETLRWAAYGAVVATALAIAGAVASQRNRTQRDLALSVIAVLVGLATFGIPGMMLIRAKELPSIHDITTDTSDPPKFVAVLPLRANARNSTDYGGAAITAQQRQAYPEIAPLNSNVSPDKAFARALEAARAMGWEIVATAPAEGRIEATDTTLLFGFKDDIVIRVTPTPGGSRTDVRSESRIGGSDVGTNARRINRFLDKLSREP
ncbi:MAG TPA: DUF1499 domain-containing protein [Casimicrobiaceae bacterium]|jgi:uncharacterized protein (DUF1499 family)